jgi:hypothetical protein
MCRFFQSLTTAAKMSGKISAVFGVRLFVLRQAVRLKLNLTADPGVKSVKKY